MGGSSAGAWRRMEALQPRRVEEALQLPTLLPLCFHSVSDVLDDDPQSGATYEAGRRPFKESKRSTRQQTRPGAKTLAQLRRFGRY